MTFQEYLISKKIDAKAFSEAEPLIYQNWEADFSQMHPNSFTVQKLNLINPVRRKYTLATPTPPPAAPATPPPDSPKTEMPAAGPPRPARPMMKPKPKMN